MKNVRHKRIVSLIINCVVQSTINKKTNRCFSKHENHELFIMIMTLTFEQIIVDVNFMLARSFSIYLSRWTTILVKLDLVSLTSRSRYCVTIVFFFKILILNVIKIDTFVVINVWLYFRWRALARASLTSRVY